MTVRSRMLSMVLCASLLAPGIARASEDAPTVTPVLKGEQAPHSGLLVSEETFIKYQKQQLDNAALKAMVKSREEAIRECEERAAAKKTWWEKHAFEIGIVVGAVAVGTAFGIRELSKPGSTP